MKPAVGLSLAVIAVGLAVAVVQGPSRPAPVKPATRGLAWKIYGHARAETVTATGYDHKPGNRTEQTLHLTLRYRG